MYKRQSLEEFIKTVSRAVSQGKSGYFSIMGSSDGWGKISLLDGKIYFIRYMLEIGAQGIVLLSNESEIQFIYQDFRNTELHKQESLSPNMNNLNFFMFFGIMEEPIPLKQVQSYDIYEPLLESGIFNPVDTGLKILVADDSRVIRDSLKRMLRPEGFLVVEAIDGIETLTILYKEKPDLVILDYTMPELDGYQVLEFIRQTSGFENLPIIMLTRHGSIRDKLKAKLSSLDAYLIKPITQDKLLKVINKLIS